MVRPEHGVLVVMVLLNVQVTRVFCLLSDLYLVISINFPSFVSIANSTLVSSFPPPAFCLPIEFVFLLPLS